MLILIVFVIFDKLINPNMFFVFVLETFIPIIDNNCHFYSFDVIFHTPTTCTLDPVDLGLLS